MAKQPISVTLAAENITWLKGRAGANGLRSVSELLDALVTAARTGGSHGSMRSVVGTIDIDPHDPDLSRADAAMRALFDASVARPLLAKESSAEYQAKPHRRRARRG